MANNNIYWSSSCGRLCLIFKSEDQIRKIFHSGQCYEDAQSELPYFNNGQQFDAYTDEMIRAVLKEVGIGENLEDMDRQDLETYLVWIAAGDMVDQIHNANDY